MEELNKKLAEIAKKHAEAMMKEVAVEYVFPALKLAAEKSETKIDDAVLAALEEPLKQAFLGLIDQIAQ